MCLSGLETKTHSKFKSRKNLDIYKVGEKILHIFADMFKFEFFLMLKFRIALSIHFGVNINYLRKPAE